MLTQRENHESYNFPFLSSPVKRKGKERRKEGWKEEPLK